MSEIEQAKARVLAQQIQITRLHTALSRIAASGELSDPQVAMAREALEACEADAGQIATDIAMVLRDVPPIPMMTPTWGAYSRLRDAFGGG